MISNSVRCKSTARRKFSYNSYDFRAAVMNHSVMCRHTSKYGVLRCVSYVCTFYRIHLMSPLCFSFSALISGYAIGSVIRVRDRVECEKRMSSDRPKSDVLASSWFSLRVLDLYRRFRLFLFRFSDFFFFCRTARDSQRRVLRTLIIVLRRVYCVYFATR